MTTSDGAAKPWRFSPRINRNDSDAPFGPPVYLKVYTSLLGIPESFQFTAKLSYRCIEGTRQGFAG